MTPVSAYIAKADRPQDAGWAKVTSSRSADSGKIAIWTGIDDDDLIVRRTSGVDYWDDEGQPL